MPDDLPVMCSLGAEDLDARLDAMGRLGDDALLAAERRGTRATLRFAARGDARRRLQRIVAAEARCCAFLTMAVTEDEDVLTLTVDAPEDAVLAVDELLTAFRP